MIVRKLLKYEWSYENGIIAIKDKFNGGTFHFPITYADSLSRALIAFKNQYRIEQVAKVHKTVASLRLSKASALKKMAERLKKVQSILLQNKQVKMLVGEAQQKLV